MSQCNKLILLQASNQDADFWFHQAHPGQTSLILITDSIKKFICKSSFHVTRQYRYCMYTIHIPRQFKWLNSFPKDKTKRIYQKLPNWMKREPGNFIQIESYTNPGSKYQQAESNNKVQSRSELWVFLTRCTLLYEQMPPTLEHWAIYQTCSGKASSYYSPFQTLLFRGRTC